MHPKVPNLRSSLAALAAALLLATGLATGAAAESDSCREWRGEHRDFKVSLLRGYLGGASQRQLDEMVFELLQREAYLSSCEQAVRSAREELVGWRLVGRVPEDYASAVVESLLESAGFDVSLRGLVGAPLPVAAAPRSGRARAGRGSR